MKYETEYYPEIRVLSVNGPEVMLEFKQLEHDKIDIITLNVGESITFVRPK